MKECTLWYGVNSSDPSRVYLGIKRQKIGAGLRNGPGGVIEDGETPIETCVREVFEEVGLILDPKNVKPAGRVDFFLAGNQTEAPDFRVFLFRSWLWTGKATNTPEMIDFRWFPLNALPKDMMPGDSLFILQVCKGEEVCLRIWYSEDKKEVAKFEYCIG